MVILVLVTRFAQLGWQGFHHDESIHSFYAWKIANEGPGTYKYNPVYHGPFLYHWGAIFFTGLKKTFLHDTDASARAPYATIGVWLALGFLLLGKRLGWGTCLLVSGLLTLSPVVTYFSRFARDDVYMAGWLVGQIAFGSLYLWTGKVRHLTLVAFFLALAYCTKENSYVNTFVPCSFLVGWGLWRAVRDPRGTFREVFVEYLPLTRLLVLVACFSVFVFSYVAIDARVSPETGLLAGIRNILTHSTAIHEKTDASVFQTENGYFSRAGREGARSLYCALAVAIPFLLLVVVESVGLRERLRDRGECSLPRLLSLAVLALLFYVLLTHRLVALAEWTRAQRPGAFLGEMTLRILMDALLLSAASLLFVLPDLLARGASTASAEGGFHRRSLWASWKEHLWGLWGLVLQVSLAAFLFLLLFSSLGTNLPKGPVDGFYDYLSYWFKHQTGDYRIWGTWWYYIPRLLLFETLSLFLILVLGLLFLHEWFRNRRAESDPPPSSPIASPAEAALHGPLWKPIPAPLLCFSVYLTVSMIAIYAVLNEKVPWLCTYQSFSLALLAGLLAGHWLATHPSSPGPVVGRILELFDPTGDSPRARFEWWRKAVPRAALSISILLLVPHVAVQHLRQVFLHPDNPGELLVYTAPNDEFAARIRKIRRLQAEAGNKLRIAVEGKAEWPCAWYFRNYDTAWKKIDPSRDIQIMDDTAGNRQKLTGGSDKVWDLDPCHLRGWWIWHGVPKALPGELRFWPNVKAFLLNKPNDHRLTFPEATRPKPEDYPVGFAGQIRRYVFFRDLWYPTGGENIVVAIKTARDVPEDEKASTLSGADRPARPLPALSSLGRLGSGPGELREPRGLAATSDGGLAVADSKNGRVQVFSASGEVRLEFGKGVLSAEFSGCSDVALAPDGSFYVTDTWNHAVRRFNAEGAPMEAVAAWTRADGQRDSMYGPRGVAVSPDGNVYVTDTGKGRVCVFDPELRALFEWGRAGKGRGEFQEPVGIAIARDGNIFVADTGNGRIQRFSSRGAFEAQWRVLQPEPHEVVGMEPNLEILPDGRLVAGYSLSGVIWVIDTEKSTVQVHRVVNPAIPQPTGLAALAAGGLWVSSRSTGQVARVRVP
ncbi:MAG: Virginiamycin B lyase [bacterium]|nr:Virginiamycin B lyase [bacterium]